MATRSAKIDQKADLIWAIADKLTGVYKPHEYGDVILPLTVIRRFDCILSDTKDAVLQKYDEVKNLPMKDILLRKASKKDFYNTSKYTFERLMDDPDHIEENFREYLNKFSANVRDILEKFKFDGHITTMANKGILYIVLKEYTTDRGNLHPNEISNLEMGYIFEEIIRRFSESHNEDAGQHYTPREVIQLMVNILFYDDKSTKGSLLEYVLKNHIDLNEYDDFASLTAELSEKVGEKLAYMMKLACDFNNLVYMARVRYNVMLSEDENTYANDEWSRLLPDIRHNATVDLDAVFGEFQLINPRAKSFLCGIQAAFITLDIDMADELIRKRERSLKGAARAKLSRTKEFDHSKWVGGGMLDYRFSNARRIVNDIYAGEVSADV